MTGTPVTAAGRVPAEAAGVDAVAAAVRSCAAVDDLCSGPWGGVVSYLPGRQVPGVRVTRDHVVVSVRSRWGAPAAGLARQVHAALAALAGGRRVDVIIADVTDPPHAAETEEVTPWMTSAALLSAAPS